MRKEKIALLGACLIAIGSTFVFANLFFATKSYRVDPIAGAPLIPLQEVGNHICAAYQQFCMITYQLDAQGNPAGPGTLTLGMYIPIQ